MQQKTVDYCSLLDDDGVRSDVTIFRFKKSKRINIVVATKDQLDPRLWDAGYAGQFFIAHDATEAIDIAKKIARRGFHIPQSAFDLLDVEAHRGRAHERCCAKHNHHVNPHRNCILR